MNSLLKLSVGILLCLPLTGCAGPGYYDPATGMVCGGEIYGPTNFMDDIRCSLSKHRAQRMQKLCGNCCDPCNACDPCGSCNPCGGCRKHGFGKKLGSTLASGTFSYGGYDQGTMETYPMESYPTPSYSSQSSCPTCGPRGGQTYEMPQTFEGPQSYEGGSYYDGFTPEGNGVPAGPATVVPQKIAPTPDHGPKGAIQKPAPAPAAEEPMSSVPPAMLHAPTTIPSSAQPNQGARRVQWVPAQIH